MKKILLLIVVTLLAGCAAVKEGSKEAVNLASVHRIITSGEASNIVQSVELTAFEQAIVTRALNHYNHEFIPKWKDKIVDIKASDPIFKEFEHDYNRLRVHFQNVKSVVENNWQEYREAEKILLQDSLKRAELADKSAQRAIRLTDYHNALLDSLQVSKFILSTALSVSPL